jgi:putative ATP-binding protein
MYSDMDNSLVKMNESLAKVLAATAMAKSLSFCTERKYLENIGNIALNPCFMLHEIENTYEGAISWIEVSQVGKPMSDNLEEAFSAIQKILYSCFMPFETQLLFLVLGNGGQNRMYLGIRSSDKVLKRNIVKLLDEFIKGVWPGLQTHILSRQGEENGSKWLRYFSSSINSDKFSSIYAITGIPSMENLYKSTYPATIDKLMAGMNKCKNYAYLVVADPIPSEDVDNILYQCREMNGQAESLKSFNLTEGIQDGTSKSYGVTDSTSEGTSFSKTKRDFSELKKYILPGTGLALAASIFPAASAVSEALVDGVGNLAIQALPLAGGMLGGTVGGVVGGIAGGLLNTLIPQTQEGTNFSKSKSVSNNTSYSESRSRSISQNVINKHIESVSEHLFYYSKRLETGKAIGMWKVGTYLMTEKEADAKGGAMQLRSILSGQESIFEPIRITDISEIVDPQKSFALYQSPLIRTESLVNHKAFEHPFGDHFKELKTVLTTKELSYLINFPLRSVPGISVIDSTPDFSLNPQPKEGYDNIAVGKMLYGGSETELEYHIPVSSLSRHTLLSGINGSGKTNTVQAILNGIKEEIPFLVIEPAKTEYVDWALEYNKNHPDNPIDIYIPGCKKYKTGFVSKQLKLNPFELVWLDKEQEPNVLTHIDRLKSTFAAAFPMYDILPILMEDLIYTVYQNKSTDWLGEEPKFGVILPPTLNSMSVSVDKVISNRQYEERIERNMKACLNTRIDSLKRGWKGEMLNTIHSTPWNELFEKPCVINLSYVGDDVDKSFFMALILQFLYEYRSALAEIGRIDFNDNGCKHLTVIEEAHRVMAKCDNQELPQYKSAMMFSNMLSEIRAYGEGMFLVDQVPTRLIPDAIKNTNLKITHRLVAEDDCKAIGESMGLSEEQRKVIAKLMTGQCVVSSSLSTDTYWVQIDKVK